MDTGKLYEIVLDCKVQTEKNRDEINKYYTSLFAALISLAPFLDKFIASSQLVSNLKYALLLLSSLGLILSISWHLNIKRIHSYLQGLDQLLISLETDCQISFIKYMSNYLSKTHAPGRVTKHQIIVPYAFIVVFLIIFLYSILCVLFS